MVTLSEHPLLHCQRCDTAYHQAKSTSSLPLTFCNELCEVATLGFHLKTFEKTVWEPKGKQEEEPIVPAKRELCEVGG